MSARVYMESTDIYHLSLYHKLKDVGVDAFALNLLSTHANEDADTNIRKTHIDKLDAERIARLRLQPDLKSSIIPDAVLAPSRRCYMNTVP